MATIYLSSTYEDLKDYRRVVFEALRKSGYQVIAMEDYVATDKRPVKKCLEDVAKADVYVGLFGFRYGYVPPPEHDNPDGLSITELELRQAEKLGIRCLIFAVTDGAPWPPKFIDSLKDGPINRLRDYLLREKTASFFSAPYQLAGLVQSAVTQHLKVEKQPDITWDIEKNGSPYPGLMSFTRDYAPVFFGRDLDVREILDRMRLSEGRFIIVSGDSGVGKSSVVAAGVLPHIEEGGLPGGETCQILHMLPGKTQQPWSSLMSAGFGAIVTRAGVSPDDILEDLHRDPKTLARHINTIVKKETKPPALLLFLDQMEELFTSQDMTQSNRFLTGIYHAVQEQVLWVVATIRSDHLHHCHSHDDMVKVLRGQGHYPVGRVDPIIMQEMVLKPAQCAGLSISERLARRLIDDTEKDTANLPLLAFVLNQLFEQRQGHELSETVYASMGGIGGAIGAHVKTVEEKIQKDLGFKIDEVLPSIFQTLANVQSEEGAPTRNRPLKSGFNPNLRKVIDLLVNERLLRTEGEGEAATVSILHEKLFKAWPALREYVTRHKKVLVDRTLLESRARKWAEMGKPWFEGLASGREYRDFQRAEMTVTSLTKDYIRASRRARWIRIVSIVVVILGVSVPSMWLWREGQKGFTIKHAVLRMASKFMSIHVAPAMQTVPAGTFRQGNTHGDGGPSEQPVHDVTIKPFAIGKFEVTFEEYDRFAIATSRLPLLQDGGLGRGRRPVINVSWGDSKDYANWLSRQTGKRYRLPTESEWEYAARSEGKNDIWAGTSDKRQLENYAVFNAKGTELVGSKNPNGLGLYDMSGNVWEWVEDCRHENYQGAPTDGSAWLEKNRGECGRRVIRGGSWFGTPENLATSYRWDLDAQPMRSDDMGFRLAQDLPQ